MPPTGYIQVHTFSSFAQIPIQDAAVAITASDGTAIALRLTDRSGLITPVDIPTPSISDSQSPETEEVPFTAVTIHARARGYEQILAENVQVFPDTVTRQELELIPLAELPEAWDKAEDFDTTPQNL